MWLGLAAGAALAAALVVGASYALHQAKELGRAECQAEHADAVREAQVLQRQKGNDAGAKFEQGRAKAQERERAVAPEVARIVGRPAFRNECVDADGLRILADDIAQRRNPPQPAPALPSAPQAP